MNVGNVSVSKHAVCRKRPPCVLDVLEDESSLEASVGENVLLAVSAKDCTGMNLSYLAEPGWLTFVNASRTAASENREKVKVEYVCRRASSFPLFASVESMDDEAVTYVRCFP
jgi:hypothetical protein